MWTIVVNIFCSVTRLLMHKMRVSCQDLKDDRSLSLSLFTYPLLSTQSIGLNCCSWSCVMTLKLVVMSDPTGSDVTGTPVVAVAYCCCCCLTCTWVLGLVSSPAEESPLLLSPPSWSLASCSASEMSGRTTPSEFEFSIWRNARDALHVTWIYFGRRLW